MKFYRYALQDRRGRYLWGVTSRQGVHFENETRPQCADLCARTKLFDSEEAAEAFVKKYALKEWGTFRVIPLEVSYSPSK